MVKISIIIPIYNTAEYIKKCLDSIINQTWKDFEIILINDGSKDDSLNIIKEYQKKFPQKIHIINQENQGQAIARNNGLKIAKGDYVLFVDSDDWIENTMLEKLYQKVIEEKADLILCNAYNIKQNKKEHYIINIPHTNNVKKDYILNNIGPLAKLIKKDVIIKNNLFFLSNHIYEDLAVIPSYAIFANKISLVEEPLYNYLIREGSTMKETKYNKNLEDIFDALENLYQIFKKHKAYEEYHEELEFLAIEHLLHGSGLRFIKYSNYSQNLDSIHSFLKTNFPNWYKNKILKKQTLKYKIMCVLLYKKQVKLIKMLKKKE